MKQEVNFKVDLENRKSLSTSIVYDEDMIKFILKSKIKLISFTNTDKTIVIGKLKKVELVHVCDSVIKFKGILVSDLEIDLSNLDIKFNFIHKRDNDDGVKIENIFGISIYLVDSKLERILKELTTNNYYIVNKRNDKPLTNAKVLFEDLGLHLKNNNDKFNIIK